MSWNHRMRRQVTWRLTRIQIIRNVLNRLQNIWQRFYFVRFGCTFNFAQCWKKACACANPRPPNKTLTTRKKCRLNRTSFKNSMKAFCIKVKKRFAFRATRYFLANHPDPKRFFFKLKKKMEETPIFPIQTKFWTNLAPIFFCKPPQTGPDPSSCFSIPSWLP